jgi:hypothetical protein
MRERITFVHGAEDAFDPKQLQIQHDFFHVKSLKAAREDRVTVSLYELPQEVSKTLTLSSWPLLTYTAMESLETMP